MQNWKRVLAFLLTLCLLSGLCVSLAEEAEDELEIDLVTGRGAGLSDDGLERKNAGAAA